MVRRPGTLLAAGVGLRERHAGGQAAASHTGYPSVATSESVPAAITLSLRRLWTIYKGASIGVLIGLAHLIERGEYPELPEIITRQGREDSVAAALNGVGGVAALAAIARNCQSGALRAPIRAPVRPIGRYVQRRRDPDGR